MPKTNANVTSRQYNEHLVPYVCYNISILTMDYSIVSVNNREGCVTKCWVNFINSSGCFPIARSPAKPMFISIYTYYSSVRYILSTETYRTLQRNDTFNTISQTNNYPLQMLAAEGHETSKCLLGSTRMIVT